MCSPSKPTVTAPPTPLETPKPLAMPDSGNPLNLSQLRSGSKNNLKLRSSEPSGGLSLGANA